MSLGKRHEDGGGLYCHRISHLSISSLLHNCKSPPSGSDLFHIRIPDCPFESWFIAMIAVFVMMVQVSLD